MAAEHGATGRGWLELKVRTPRQRAAALEWRVRGVTLCMHTHTHTIHPLGWHAGAVYAAT